MNAAACIALVALIGVCVYSSASDIRTERIPNKALAIPLVLALLLAVVQCGFISPELRLSYVLNVSVTCLLSLVLFYTNTWAGGDCKLACVLALLYPPSLYVCFGDISFTLPIAVGFAFMLGSLYLLASVAARWVRERPPFSVEEVARQFKAFLLSYACGLALIGALHLVNALLIARFYSANPILITVVGFCIIWLLASKGLLKSKLLLAALLAFDCIASMATASEPLGLSWQRCLFVLVVVLLRIVVSQQNYKSIPTAEVSEGMILTTASSLMLMTSRIKGLPGVSTEDLRSRLSPEEAESVRRWGASTKGTETIQVVRKMPFAIFVSLGYVAYLALWGIM